MRQCDDDAVEARPEKPEEKLSTTLCGIAGEYFVAAELSRNGFIAAITLRNTRGIDIVVSRPGSRVSATIQVKTMQRRARRWLLDKSDEVGKGKNHYYVFVLLNGASGSPEYFIVDGDRVAKFCRKSHRDWLAGKKRDGGIRKDSRMRVYIPQEGDRNAWDRICLV